MINELIAVISTARKLRDSGLVNLDTDLKLIIGNRRNGSDSSLLKKASDSVAYFPILMSENVSTETMTLIRKAFEREYAVLIGYTLQDHITSVSRSEREGGLRQSILSNVHTNIGIDTGMNNVKNYANITYNNVVDRALREGVEAEIDTDNLTKYNFLELGRINDLYERHKMMLNEGFFNEAKRKVTNLNTSDIEDAKRNGDGSIDFSAYLDNDLDSAIEVDMDGNVIPPGGDTPPDDPNGPNNGGNDNNNPDSSNTTEVNNNNTPSNDGGNGGNTNNRNRTRNRNERYNVREVLSSTEIKKENELLPSIINVKAKYTDNQGRIGELEVMQGIKAIVHPLKSSELTYFLPETVKNNKLVFTFIRWTTGEIKFWKDIVFQMDYAKKLVKNNGSNTSKWWRTLTYLGSVKKYSKWLGGSKKMKNLIPNATLVITTDEVEIIKRKYGIDVLKGKSLDILFDKMFLMRLAVVSEADEIVTVIDANGVQKYTFKVLEKENNNKNLLKDFLSLSRK